MMTRPEMLKALWAKASETLFISREQYLAQLEGWEIDTVDQDGAPVLIVMRKGPEFHFMTLEATARLSRGTVRTALAPQLDAFGYVLTKTPRPEERQHRFNKVVGFVQVGEDEYNIHYRLDRGRCAVTRSTPCPSPLS